jgi:MYXO-CTERM domain-containing protein
MPPHAEGVSLSVIVWVVQILLALAFLTAGIVKVTQPHQKLAATMGWVEDFSDPGVRTIGSLEILGALGLLLPALTGMATMLVPVAAVGLALLMVGAAATHRRRAELAMIGVNAVLLVLAVVVAWARFGPYSL